ncbi:Anti-sigma-I factor RsgI3 [bacterium HR35]|nr:Anti-sigma-I factor RsgI3 [bacterium HR35]
MKKGLIISLALSLLFALTNIIFYFFLPKESLGQGAYCQPLPYLNWGETTWPGAGYLVMTSSTQNVLVRYTGSLGIGGSGSAGQVAFWTGASTISGDNNLFWDNTNKRLGIGTTTPTTTLHVAGNVKADTFLGTINAANVSSGQFGANTGGGNYSFPGNVGIGTTTPEQKVHIASNSNSELQLLIRNDNTGPSADVRIAISTAWGGATANPMLHFAIPGVRDWIMGIDNADGDKFKIARDFTRNFNNPAIVIDVNNNIGIGTTTPTTKLTIYEGNLVDAVFLDSPGWPPRRIVQKGGIIVEGFGSYDPNPYLSFKDKIMRIVKPTIDFTDLNPLGKADGWSLRVYGCVYIPVAGTYTFYVTSDDGVRLWVNWQILVDQWRDQGATTYSANYTFSSPGWYPLRIDHYENAGGERLLLEWSGPGISRQVIPSTNLGICWPDLY